MWLLIGQVYLVGDAFLSSQQEGGKFGLNNSEL